MAINTDNQLLLGQRAFRRTRHPGVLSTITQMIGPGQRRLVESNDYRAVSEYIIKMIDDRLSDALSFKGFIVESNSLLKLVEDPQGTGVAEWTRMHTIKVQLTQPWHPKPHPYYYENVGWFPQDKFKEAYEKNEAQLLLPNANPITLCMDGACVDGAYAMLEDNDGTDDLYPARWLGN